MSLFASIAGRTCYVLGCGECLVFFCTRVGSLRHLMAEYMRVCLIASWEFYVVAAGYGVDLGLVWLKSMARKEGVVQCVLQV